MNANKHLLIISDTRIQKVAGVYYAFNSVVKELDVFTELFGQITWIGYDYSDCDIDRSLMPVKYPQVRIVLLKRTGGKDFWSKLKILNNLWTYASLIRQYITDSDVIHSRGPSVPMLIALVYSFFYRKPRWWFKYANNWNDPSPPFFWGLQKKMMLHNRRSTGTINGNWPHQPAHLLTFENPCLYSSIPAPDLMSYKSAAKGWRLLFVGRIERQKGYHLCIDLLSSEKKSNIESLTIIGDGSECSELKRLIKNHICGDRICYLGSLENDAVFDQMRAAHFLLLPSTSSEGFPKVVAEAWYNGCLPVVSDVSSLSQYVVNGKNGFLWNPGGEKSFSDTCAEALSSDNSTYTRMVESGLQQASLFTYARYRDRIIKDIL
jgi:glycosyltransferase involved in cell wall biosynthesis